MAKIKLNKDLYQRACEVAQVAGYSSVDEFVEHLVERALRDAEPSDEDDQRAVEDRLRGLGYIE